MAEPTSSSVAGDLGDAPVEVPGSNGSGGRAQVSPPPAATVQARRWLDERLARIDEDVREVQREWVRSMDRRVRTTFQMRLTRAVHSHARLRREHTSFDPAAGQQAIWQAVMTYRQGVRARVLEPLTTFLQQASYADAIGTTFGAMLTGLAGLVEDAPETLMLAEPADLYQATPTDRLWTQVRKGGVRAGRWVRRLGRSKTTMPTYAVPVRSLLQYHAEVRLPRKLEPVLEAYQVGIATPIARLEATLTSWTNSLLRCEERLDRPDFHIDPEHTKHLQAVADIEALERLAQEARTQADMLHAALTDAVEALRTFEVEPASERDFDRAAACVADDLRQGGTFMLNSNDRSVPSVPNRPATLMRDRQQVWATWHQQVIGRLTILRHLIVVRNAHNTMEDDVLRRIASATLHPVRETFAPLVEHLHEQEQIAQAACSAAAGTRDFATLRQALDDVRTSAMEQLKTALDEMPGVLVANQALSQPGAIEWQKLQVVVDALPRTLHIHLPQTERPQPEARTLPIDLRQMALETLRPPLPEKLKAPADAFRQSVTLVWTEAQSVPQIIQYNLQAALDELDSALDTETALDPQETPIEAASELSIDGIRRAAQAIESLERGLAQPWERFALAVYSILENEWKTLHGRVRSDDYERDQWRGFVVQVQHGYRTLSRWVAERAAGLRKRASLLLRIGQRRAQRLIQQGQSAVGVLAQAEEAQQETMELLSDLESLHASLPRIYRRLFSFDALSEPSMLENRQRDFVWMQDHYRRWLGGRQAGVLVVTGPLGGGRTSLLNTLHERVLADADAQLITFEKRPESADDVAERFAEALGYTMEGRATLDKLEAQILSQPRSDPPRACLIDNIEHLMLQVPGGTDLMEQVFIFLSRTDTRIYWVATMGSLTWHFLSRTAKGVSSFVNRHELTPLNERSLEALILNRHQRSGMPIRFVEPTGATAALLRQRLRRARSEEEKQTTLRTEYFDRLFRLSGQNLMLAFFYWLRSADFTSEPGLLTVQPLKPLQFGFLSTFDLPRAFTLKAFVLHHSLSLAEHARIFRLSHQESTFMLEALLNLRIIEPFGPTPDDGTLDFGRLNPDDRYRIRPLILHPVVEYLLAKHIVY